jgi:hypothetical protein
MIRRVGFQHWVYPKVIRKRKEEKGVVIVMKKLVLFVGMGAGFVLGSWAGRAPFERLQATVRDVMGQPKVQTTLQSAAESAGVVREATLDAATEVFGDVADAATGVIDDASKRVADRTRR